MSKESVCKKCGKKLPPNYRGKYCEACKGNFAHGAKKAGEIVVGVGVVAVGVVKALPKIL